VGSLESAVRRVGGWCETAASLGVSQLEQRFGKQVHVATDKNRATEELQDMVTYSIRREVIKQLVQFIRECGPSLGIRKS
jgi:hypothetical protein